MLKLPRKKKYVFIQFSVPTKSKDKKVDAKKFWNKEQRQLFRHCQVFISQVDLVLKIYNK